MKNKFWLFSYLMGFISFVGIIYQNYKLAEIYKSVSGKTQALFGIIELTQVDIKIYLGIISLIGFILGFISFNKKNNKIHSLAGMALNSIVFTLLFIRFWRNFL